jgi:hypothetical protein
MMILEGNLLEAAAIENPDSLSYKLTEAIEPLSVLGEFELPADVVVRVADKIVSANGFDTMFLQFNESTVFQLESLKHILCGFSVDFIDTLFKSAVDKRSLLHCLGLVRSCENGDILEILAKQVKFCIKLGKFHHDLLTTLGPCYIFYVNLTSNVFKPQLTLFSRFLKDFLK